MSNSMTQSDTVSLDTVNSNTVNSKSVNLDTVHTDVLVIGAGLAGLSTAMSLPKDLRVVVLAKQDIYDCSSNYAQGGIAAVIDKDDNVADHVSDTLIAGDGLCDKQATTQILSQGRQAIDWLVKQDVPFTTKFSTQPPIKASIKASRKIAAKFLKIADADVATKSLDSLHLTQEGGHGRRRVIHADDATGKHIMHTLHEQVAHATNISVLPYHEALSLNVTEMLTKALSTEKRCTGATVLDVKSGKILTVKSSAVVLASGGLGQLFSRATAPDVCVGDGIMMAWEAGCRLANLEFVQFHPTGLALGDSNFLISEAVRGEGGHLICPLTHTRFMPNYDKREELAPRDIVARSIANEIANNGLGYVYLDISHQPAEFIKAHFPDIYAHCLALGVDITTDPIPVAPTAHYTCGGVMTTASGHTDLTGLYAAGEVAHTGLHGANRLASNSLLECVVVGREIATHIPIYLDNPLSWQRPMAEVTKTAGLQSSLNTSVKSNVSNFKALNQIDNRAALLLTNNEYAESIAHLKQLMTNNMGIRRNEADLTTALKQVQTWKQPLSRGESTLSHTQSEPSQLCDVQTLRWLRLLTLAELLLTSALNRLESRGGHYRNDFPQHHNAAEISVIYPNNETDCDLITDRLIDDFLFNSRQNEHPMRASSLSCDRIAIS